MPNDAKIIELTNDDGFRAKVAATMDTLRAKGYPDVYIVEAMRTKEQQREKVQKGYSKTMNSYHLKRGSDGKGKAADIVPKSKGWNLSKRYAFMYGWLCYRHGLGWGGLFGLSGKQKAKALETMRQLSDAGWPQDSPLYQVALGWDQAHCQKDSNW